MRATNKSNKCDKNTTLRWTFQEAVANYTTDNVEQVPMLIGAPETNINKIVDTISFLYRLMHQIHAAQASDAQHMTNIFVHLQHQVSELQTAAGSSINMVLDNERFRNVSYVKQFISFKFIYVLKWPLSKRVGV